MKYRLVQTIENQLVVSEFDSDNVLPAMEIRGFELRELNNNQRHRTELQGQPIFNGVLGPMWDGDAVRYEDQQTYNTLSI
jgi:hypothetical protein